MTRESTVRLAPALPTCACHHTAATHYPRNPDDADTGRRPCWVCGCRDYDATTPVYLAEAVHAWLIETYGSRIDQLKTDWERDAGALLGIIEEAQR